MPKCGVVTGSGNPCKRDVSKGDLACFQHDPKKWKKNHVFWVPAELRNYYVISKTQTGLVARPVGIEHDDSRELIVSYSQLMKMIKTKTPARKSLVHTSTKKWSRKRLH